MYRPRNRAARATIRQPHPRMASSFLVVGVVPAGRALGPRPPRATGSLRADWTTTGSRGAAGQSVGPRSALDAGGGQVAARPAGNRPVRARAQGSRARRRRRGRSPPVTSSPPPTWQRPPDHPRPAGRGGQPPPALPPLPDALAGAAGYPAGQGHGSGDPNERRLLA